MSELLATVSRGPAWLTWTTAALLALSVLGLHRIQINDDFVRYFDESFEFRQAAEFSQAHMSGPNALELVVAAAEADGIFDPEYLEVLRDMGTWLREQPLIANTVTLADVVWKVAAEFDDPRIEDLDRERIAQYVLAYELSLTAGQQLEDFLDKTRSSTRVSILLSGGDSQAVVALEERIYDWFAVNAPDHFDLTVTGINVPVAHMSLLNIRSMLAGILGSLVIIAAVVGTYFRSARILWITAPAILLPIAMGFGLWGWFVVNIGLAAAVIAAVTIGIVVDDAIHVIYRYRHARTVSGAGPGEAARIAVLTVGNAVLITSLALAVGFSFLALSGFEINRSLGLCTVLIVLCGMLVDLVLLPRVMMRLDARTD
jgi:predicted RND superfamily exporter protein